LDAETPGPDLEDDRESFSRSLVNPPSAADRPLVNVPAMDRLSAKTGRRKKGVREVFVFATQPRLPFSRRLQGMSNIVADKLADGTDGAGVTRNVKQSPAVVISTVVSPAVVKLLSPRRSLSASTEATNLPNSTAGLQNCDTEGGLSAESQTSDNSVAIYSVSNYYQSR
jgi:hypothetical protein